MSNKKNLDKSFDALYTLKKRNLLNQTSKSKKIQFFTSSEMTLSRAGGLDDILSNITRIKSSGSSLVPWLVANPSSYNTYIVPGPMAVDPQGNFYIGNTNSSRGPLASYPADARITKVDSNGNWLYTYNPPPGNVTIYQQGVNAADGWPWGVAYYNGIIYAGDMRKQFIYSFNTATSVWTKIIGLSGTTGFTSGLVGASSRIAGPMTILSDNAGNLYICQADNHCISKYVISTGILTTFAGTGVGGYANGPGTSAQFDNQNGIFFDNSGNIIVCDSGNDRIRKIDINTQVVTTIAGSGVGGRLDGPVGSATFDFPNSGCCDANGNLYINSSIKQNGYDVSIIRKISNGVVTTIFEPGTNGMPPTPSVTNMFYYQGYVYLSEQTTYTTYRFAV